MERRKTPLKAARSLREVVARDGEIMSGGGWIKFPKNLIEDLLPRGRAYTEIEAAASILLDYDQGRDVTASGYSSLWGWGKDRVRRFVGEMGFKIVYPIENTRKNKKQKGRLQPLDFTSLKTVQNQSKTSLKKDSEIEELSDPPVYNQSKTSLKPSHYYKTKTKTKTETPTNPHDTKENQGSTQGVGDFGREDQNPASRAEIEDHIRLMHEHAVVPDYIRDRAAYLRSIEKRLRVDGLQHEDREQARAWQRAEKEKEERRRHYEAAEALAREYGLC